jgi:hypothetical protein
MLFVLLLPQAQAFVAEVIDEEIT